MATLEDIGKKTGCSAATISRILNNSAPVSDELRDAVMKEIKRSGYIPKPRKRRSVEKDVQSDTVEVIMSWKDHDSRLEEGRDNELELSPEDLSEERSRKDSFKIGYGFFRHIVDGMIEELTSMEMKAALRVANDLSSPRLLADINRKSNRGVLLLGAYSPHLRDFINACSQPLVLVDLMADSWPDVVTIDNYGGIRQAFNHLRELGHHDIGFISYDTNPAYRERETAFRACMVSAGLPVRQDWIFEGAVDIDRTADGVEAILKRSERPSVFLCACDYAALGVIRAAGRCGVSVPGELSVMGFDDSDPASMVTPALSTIHVPTAQLGRQAVRQLLMCERSNGRYRQDRGCEIRVRTDLVVRQSTGPVKR